MEQSSDKKCTICGAKSGQTCSNCGSVFYCCKEHQKQDWPKHKKICKPYRVECNEILGRHLVAKRNLKPGEVILKEEPVVVGPRIDIDPSNAICPGCNCILPSNPATCPRCSITPICSLKCARISEHVYGECNAIKNSEGLSQSNLIENEQIIMPLRCLLIKNRAESIWNAIVQMEGHVEQRRHTAIWRHHHVNTIQIMKKYKLYDESQFSDEFVQKICGILDVNSFELRGPNVVDLSVSGKSNCVRGLYLEAALMAHDCVGNTHISVDDNFMMTVHASVDIERGTPIYFNYTNALQGTHERQEHLREGKYFECKCKRCEDPSELGTYLSSIICPRCKTGMVSPDNSDRIPISRYKHDAWWICDKCECRYRGSLIRSTVNLAADEIEDLDKTDARKIELMLKKLLRTLPSGHHLIIDLKQTLIGVYREIFRRDPNPSRKVLTRKLELCKELVPLLEAVEPGISRLRGIALYEMHIPIVILSNREYENKEIRAEILLKRLLEADDALRNATKLLFYEPAASPEGRLAKKALEEIKMLAESIAGVKQLVRKDEEKRNSRKRGKRNK